MPQLSILRWNEHDQLQMSQRQAVHQTDGDGVERQGERTWYVYDSRGQRIRKVTELPNGQVKDERLYLGALEIYRRPADNLVRETLHIMDDQQRVAMVETRTHGNEPGIPRELVRYQLSNHLGSACVEVDDQARVLSYEEYTPYGSTTYQAVRSQLQTPKRYRFTGMERDEESGLSYHMARYYAPWLGRWTACDPAGLIDAFSLYVYAGNNPLKLVDPSGSQCDPTMQSCIDPTEPTPREEVLQQSLPEEERYLPPPAPATSPGAASSLPTSAPGLPGWSIASGGVGLTSLGLRTSFYPVNAAGEALRGPLILWTGSDALNRAREMAAAGRGYTIFDTPYFGAARAEELAMARAAMGLPEGAIITDLTPELERRALPIWERYSYELTRDAAISGVGVETANAPGTIRPGSIQANVEGPWARGLGAGMGALNVAGGAFMLASIDTEHDPGLLTAGKITSGGLSVVGGGLEVYGAVTLTAGATTVGAGLATGGAVIAVPIIVYEVGRPRGWIAIDPEMMERDTQRYRNGENVNPFCNQCHGRGGALDPDNDWNAGGARRAAFAARIQWRYLGD
jgi:RHS repeat-associated protein